MPATAITLSDGRNYIYVLNADGATVARHTVITGRRVGGRIEVISGLDADANVVAGGGSFLADGALIKIVMAIPVLGEPT